MAFQPKADQGAPGASAWPVDGSGTTQPVSGPLTDTQLRATPVPVSGTVTANAGTGTMAVSGPLTDTQLRATAVPVSGTVSATQSGTWTVQPGNTANTTAWKVDGSAVTQPVSGTVTANAGTGTLTVNDVSATTGGLSIYRNLDPNATGSLVKGSAGQIYAITIANAANADRYVKIYNKATAPTVGTDTPIMTFVVPKNTNVGYREVDIPKGIALSLGIGVGCTTTAPDAAVTSPAANDVIVHVFYK